MEQEQNKYQQQNQSYIENLVQSVSMKTQNQKSNMSKNKREAYRQQQIKNSRNKQYNNKHDNFELELNYKYQQQTKIEEEIILSQNSIDQNDNNINLIHQQQLNINQLFQEDIELLYQYINSNPQNNLIDEEITLISKCLTTLIDFIQNYKPKQINIDYTKQLTKSEKLLQKKAKIYENDLPTWLMLLINQQNNLTIWDNTSYLNNISLYFSQQQEYDILLDIAFLYVSVQNLPFLNMEQKIQNYFKVCFNAQNFQMIDKVKGVQYGKIVSFEIQQQQLLQQKYYVKTHSGGQLIEQITNDLIKDVCVLELLIYKVLQYTEYGVKCQFFFQDLKNFFISTEDASQYSQNKQIIYYDDLQLQHIKNRNENLEGFIEGLFDLDILQRLLFLSDITNNKDNFLFCLKNNRHIIKIIDFFVNGLLQENKIQNTIKIKNGVNIFQSFLKGNYSFQYQSQSIIIAEYLGTSYLKERYMHAKNFNYQALIFAIDNAINYLKQYNNSTQQQFQFQLNLLDKQCNFIKKIIQEFQIECLRFNDLNETDKNYYIQQVKKIYNYQ